VQPCKSQCRSASGYPPLPADRPGFQPVIPAGTKVGSGNPPGFPSLKTLGHTARIHLAGVTVFGQPSRKESLIITLKDATSVGGGITAALVAEFVIGQRCYIKWPYLQEAIITAVSDASATFSGGAATTSSMLGKREVARVSHKTHSQQDVSEWKNLAQRRAGEFLTKSGIDVGRVDVLLHVRCCEGLVRYPNGALLKKWSDEETLHPLQVCRLGVYTHPKPFTLDP
jgi:5'-3' exoribonuclease 1